MNKIFEQPEEKSTCLDKPEMDAKLRRIIECYQSFNDTGKAKLASYAEDLKIAGMYDEHSNVRLFVLK